jgi:hypothetical protein
MLSEGTAVGLTCLGEGTSELDSFAFMVSGCSTHLGCFPPPLRCCVLWQGAAYTVGSLPKVASGNAEEGFAPCDVIVMAIVMVMVMFGEGMVLVMVVLCACLGWVRLSDIFVMVVCWWSACSLRLHQVVSLGVKCHWPQPKESIGSIANSGHVFDKGSHLVGGYLLPLTWLATWKHFSKQ